MPKAAMVLNVFLASPSDVGEEREAVERVIATINLSEAAGKDVVLNLIRWENCFPGASSKGVQEVINEQVKRSGVDIFLSVMWRNLGTPTRRADSGTVEELVEAYEQWQRAGAPHLCVYFKDTADSTQPDTVTPFRKRLEASGTVFYGRFGSSPGAFEALLYQDIPRIAREVLESRKVITKSSWIFGNDETDLLLLCGGLIFSEPVISSILHDERESLEKRKDLADYPLGKKRSRIYPDSQTLRFSATDVIGSSEIRALAHLCTAFASPLAPRKLTVTTDISTEDKIKCDLISLGAYSNSRSLEIIRHASNQLITPALFQVGPHEWDARFISKSTGQPVHEKLKANQDIGLILKIRPKANSARTWLFCGGLGEWGTSGAANFLANRWDELVQALPGDSNNFAALLSVVEGSDERVVLNWVKTLPNELDNLPTPTSTKVIRLDRDQPELAPPATREPGSCASETDLPEELCGPRFSTRA